MKRYHFISDQALNEMVNRRVEEQVALRMKDVEQERLNSQIDLAVLQAQINPHFLYNTLESIRGQAIAAGQIDIADTTHTLSRFFRYCISSRSPVSSLKDEIEHVQNYLRILQYRFQNRFTLDIRYNGASDEVLEGLLPKMTLQPIVENAVLHGFDKVSSNARITISIVETWKHLNIVVQDNGVGMDRNTLAQISARLKGGSTGQPADKGKGGIGIVNVDQRLKLFFGEEYGLSLQSARGIGTSVEIHIPYKV